MKFLTALFWETLQNLPMFAGFLIGARLRSENLALGLACALGGIIAGVVLMHFTEARLHAGEYTSTLKGTLINGLVFFALAVPFLFYFSVENRWINWKSDVILGILVGLGMGAAQSFGWDGERRVIVKHALAMAAACPLIMLAVRYTLRLPPWGWMLLACLLFTITISGLIVLIDYWPALKTQERILEK